MEQPIVDIYALPPEMMEKIMLQALQAKTTPITRKGLIEWDVKFGNCINYRLVDRAWRQLVDDIMAVKLISCLQLWCPNRYLFQKFPFPVKELVYEKPKRNGVDHVSASFIVDDSASCPFPAKTLKFSFRVGIYTSLSKENLVFEEFGGYLSVLCLWEMDMHISGLRSILKACNNLKALVLSDVTVCVDGDEDFRSGHFNLPSLPSLTTLQILSNYKIYTNVVNKDGSQVEKPVKTKKWPFEGLTEYLEFLDMFCFNKVNIARLPKVKNLLITTECLSFLPKIGSAESLERLSVSRCGKVPDWKFGTVNDLIVFIDQTAFTAKELYLDVYWENRKQMKIRSYVVKQIESVVKLTLTGFDLCYEMIKKILLPKFPFLRHFAFLCEERISTPCPYFNAVHSHIKPVPKMWKKFRSICNNLHTISERRCVHNDEDPENVIYQHGVKKPYID